MSLKLISSDKLYTKIHTLQLELLDLKSGMAFGGSLAQIKHLQRLAEYLEKREKDKK